MRSRDHSRFALAAVLLCGLAASWVLAQHEPVWPPEPPPVPPPAPEEDAEAEEDAAGDETGESPGERLDTFLPDTDRPWGLDPELLESLAVRADDYRNYALRFVCRETVRSASYDRYGEASKENRTLYEYILERKRDGFGLNESRARVKSGGKTVPADSAEDQVSFPPAYAWTLLFSRFNQAYFDYRDLGDRFEGFDWVRAIEFKGSLPWNGGRDIREWEGVAIVDAGDYNLLEIRAQPTAQRERMQALYKRWVQSFNLLGARLAEKPRGYRCRVALLMKRDGLTFPTRLRYDTLRLVTFTQLAREEASIREYSDYRFFGVETEERVEGTGAAPGRP